MKHDLADRFRETMRRTASGVAVLTTDGEAGRAGITVSTLCSLSMEPPSVIACVHRDNRALETIIKNGANPAEADIDFTKGVILGKFFEIDKPTCDENYRKMYWPKESADDQLQTG